VARPSTYDAREDRSVDSPESQGYNRFASSSFDPVMQHFRISTAGSDRRRNSLGGQSGGRTRNSSWLLTFPTPRHDIPDNESPEHSVRKFGSAQVRISVSINPPASSAYRRPVRNLPPPGSAWGGFRQFGRRATGKDVAILQLSAAMAKRGWSS
jgi:hypothetical protein